MKSTKSLVRDMAAIKRPVLSAKTVSASKARWAQYRKDAGWAASSPPLLTPPTANMKLGKTKLVKNYGLSLSPDRVSGVLNTCPKSTKGCRELCINVSGNGYYPKIQASRILKTKFLVDNTEDFLVLLASEIKEAKKSAKAEGMKLAVRLNVFSDIPWEQAVPWLFSSNRDVIFYDYTKDESRNNLPKNYSLTFSASERMKDEQIINHVKNGNNVAIVADLLDGEAPSTWNELPVIDGDLTDYRPSDPKGVIVFLKPKGRARSAAKVPRGGFIRTQDGFR